MTTALPPSCTAAQGPSQVLPAVARRPSGLVSCLPSLGAGSSAAPGCARLKRMPRVLSRPCRRGDAAAAEVCCSSLGARRTLECTQSAFPGWKSRLNCCQGTGLYAAVHTVGVSFVFLLPQASRLEHWGSWRLFKRVSSSKTVTLGEPRSKSWSLA